MIVSAIAAVAENGTIGRDNDLPWHLPDDLKFFQRTTRGHHVITGRRNYESIPPQYRPLKDRVNVVITHDPSYEAPGAVVVHSLEAALEHCRTQGEQEAMVIGGGQVFHEALGKGLLDRIYLTRVHAQVPGDVFFPTFDQGRWKEVSREDHPADGRHQFAFSFMILDRI